MVIPRLIEGARCLACLSTESNRSGLDERKTMGNVVADVSGVEEIGRVGGVDWPPRILLVE